VERRSPDDDKADQYSQTNYGDEDPAEYLSQGECQEDRADERENCHCNDESQLIRATVCVPALVDGSVPRYLEQKGLQVELLVDSERHHADRDHQPQALQGPLIPCLAWVGERQPLLRGTGDEIDPERQRCGEPVGGDDDPRDCVGVAYAEMPPTVVDEFLHGSPFIRASLWATEGSAPGADSWTTMPQWNADLCNGR
jgi:hypothetical protein